MAKTCIGMYEVVAAKATLTPYTVKDFYGREFVGYRVDEKELKTAFGTNGFNLNNKSWKNYVDTWKQCNMLIPDIGGKPNTFYLSRSGLELIKGGKTQMMRLDQIAQATNAEVLA